MTEDLYLYRAATVLMERQDEEAAAAKGDVEGVAARRAIRRAVEELQRGRERGEALN